MVDLTVGGDIDIDLRLILESPRSCSDSGSVSVSKHRDGSTDHPVYLFLLCFVK